MGSLNLTSADDGDPGLRAPLEKFFTACAAEDAETALTFLTEASAKSLGVESMLGGDRTVHIGKEVEDGDRFVLPTALEVEDEKLDLPIVLEQEAGEWRINLIETMNRMILAQEDDDEGEDDLPVTYPERVWTINRGLESLDDDDVGELAFGLAHLFDPPFEVEEAEGEPVEEEAAGKIVLTMRIGEEGRCFIARYETEAAPEDDDCTTTITADGLEEGKEFSLQWAKSKDPFSGTMDCRVEISAAAPESTLEAMDRYLSERF